MKVCQIRLCIARGSVVLVSDACFKNGVFIPHSNVLTQMGFSSLQKQNSTHLIYII